MLTRGSALPDDAAKPRGRFGDLTGHALHVLDAIYTHGDGTADEVSKWTGLPHQIASARVSDLYREGWLHDTGRRRLTRFGRGAVVYEYAVLDEGERREKKPKRTRIAAAVHRVREECREIALDALEKLSGFDRTLCANALDEAEKSHRERRT